MVFVLDNYDSFTYNLVQYLGELGAEMTIRRLKFFSNHWNNVDPRSSPRAK